jgi:hypothetical protein
MTPTETYQVAQAQTETAVTTLMQWVTEAQKNLASDKLDSTARARLGELLINACRYLAEREAMAKKAADKAAHEARPDIIAFNKRMEARRMADFGVEVGK